MPDALKDAAVSKDESTRKVGVLQLVCIAYFCAAGGPFGLEACIQVCFYMLFFFGFVMCFFKIFVFRILCVCA